MIELTGITKAYNGRIVLDALSLNLEEGKIHVLLGSSGSGKSTLLKIVMGLVQPEQGFVKVGDIIVTSKTQKKFAQKIGYVVQEGGLYPHMTAAENVTLMARLGGWSSDKMRTRILELAELVGFEDNVLDQYPHELSGGQKQRVGLMRALMLEPTLLVLDEPLGSLDPIIRYDLQVQLKKIFQELKKSVILVTHDLSEAAFFGDTVTLMNDGRVIQSGPLSDLIKNPADPFVTRFINAQRQPVELQNA